MAFYSNSSCNINSYFAQQFITLNIALCGDCGSTDRRVLADRLTCAVSCTGAGNPGVYAQTCTGSCSSAVASASTYANAYFEIVSLRVYSGGLNTQNNRNTSSIAGDIGSRPWPNSATRCSWRSQQLSTLAAGLGGVATLLILS